jgi:iron(III) transport system substrate-binding protein
MIDSIRTRSAAAIAGMVVAVTPLAAMGQDQSVNIYTARHYDTDIQLYDAFTAETGIAVNIIEGDSDELIERILREGVNSPADIFVTVDAGRLWRAVEGGILAPTDSEILNAAIPESLRHPDGLWFGFSKRARILLYNNETVDDPSRLTTYEALADPDLGYTICIRSSSNVYNQSLLASLIAHHGEVEAEAWAAGVVANMGRDPEGGDTPQITGTAAGECDIAVANHYYFTRIAAETDPESQGVVAALTPLFPNQDGRGTHVNISGAGVVATAPHHDAAVRFLEYLATPSAQTYFAAGNYELPVVAEAELAPELQRVLEMAGVDAGFKQDSLNLSVLGENNPLAVMIFDRVGWK